MKLMISEEYNNTIREKYEKNTDLHIEMIDKEIAYEE
jgi:hypothetical protein